MAPVMPLGQYIAGSSPVHQLDARMKLLLLMAYVTGLFLSGWAGLLLFAGLLVGAYVLAEIDFKLAFRGLKPILFLLIFTFLANSLTFSALPADQAPSASMGMIIAPESIAWFGSFGIKPLGILKGLYFALRIVLLISMTSLLSYTTSIVALSDALAKLLRPLEKLKVPVEDIATMFSIALRFIPITSEEADRIMVSQSARGASFNKGGPIKRIKAWLPVMVPLFVSLFRRADAIASAMETRCYSGQGRTHIREDKLDETELATGFIGAFVLIILGIVL